jgi:GTP cyclohydrolase I
MINENFNIENTSLTEELKINFSNIISLLVENIDREGLVKTPERASKAMKFLTSGYETDPK